MFRLPQSPKYFTPPWLTERSISVRTVFSTSDFCIFIGLVVYSILPSPTSAALSASYCPISVLPSAPIMFTNDCGYPSTLDVSVQSIVPHIFEPMS